MKKRVVSMLMAGAMMLSCFTGMTMSAHAANVADTSFAFNNVDDFSYSEWRDKTNTTKVYVYPQSGLTIDYIVQGRINPASQTYDRSEAATIPIGVKGSITNFVRENAGTQARLRFERREYSQAYTRGVWSPDSTQNYTVYP